MNTHDFLVTYAEVAAADGCPDEARQLQEAATEAAEAIDTIHVLAEQNVELRRELANEQASGGQVHSERQRMIGELEERVEALEAVVNSPDTAIMPRRLTAENGAKGLLSGEFYEEVEVLDETWGPITQRTPVSWSTIKAIYRMAVKHLAADAKGEDDGRRGIMR